MQRAFDATLTGKEVLARTPDSYLEKELSKEEQEIFDTAIEIFIKVETAQAFRLLADSDLGLAAVWIPKDILLARPKPAKAKPVKKAEPVKVEAPVAEAPVVLAPTDPAERKEFLLELAKKAGIKGACANWKIDTLERKLNAAGIKF